MLIKRSVLFLILLSWGVVYGQKKFEKEFRLKEEDVPPAALQFVQPDELDARVKWYFEENLEGNSVEAKLKRDGQRFSIEFDTTGTFLDIEVLSALSVLSKEVRDSIDEHLESSFQRYKVQKLQLQYSGRISSFDAFLRSVKPSEDFILRYELILKAKRESQWALYEITFTERGDHLTTSRIVLRNTDNLEF